MPSQAETIEALRKAKLPVDPVYTPTSPADPYAAGMTFGSALGIPDAIRALKGDMTEDEAKMFALSALPGLIPGAKPEMAAAKGVAKAAPAIEEGIQNLIDTFGPKAGSAAKASLPDISQAAIEKGLAENPGASIFDLAGMHVGGPSSDYAATGGTGEVIPFKQLGSFPSEVPFQPPEKATKLGFITPAVHGTRAGEHRWIGGMDELKLPDDELGVHFGTPDQASNFTSNVLGAGYLPRSYPVVMKTGNALELPDLGTWHTRKVVGALRDLNNYGQASSDLTSSRQGYVADKNMIGMFPEHELENIEEPEDLRAYLKTKGFDSVKYKNLVEGEGQTSHIMFTPSAENPDYVGGVRSPFAAFDPSKLSYPSLAAGVGGVAAMPQIGEYIQALQSGQDQQ